MSEENINDIVVSVCMLAYNHEQFIAKAIDSVLSQHFQYKYEIVIGEDCSTDSTLSICKEYAAKYPQIIRLLAHPTNQGLIKNYVSVMNAARGKYIAVCSGDDYWCDERKLQKQVDFMESNPDYSMCFTNAYEESNYSWEGYRKRILSNVENRDYNGEEIFSMAIPASSVLFKNGLIDFCYLFNRNYFAEDLVTWLKLCECGKVRGIRDLTVSYVRHNGAIMDMLLENRDDALSKEISYFDAIDAEFSKKYHQLIVRTKANYYYKSAKYEWKSGSKMKSVIYLIKSVICHPRTAFMKLINSLIH